MKGGSAFVIPPQFPFSEFPVSKPSGCIGVALSPRRWPVWHRSREGRRPAIRTTPAARGAGAVEDLRTFGTDVLGC